MEIAVIQTGGKQYKVKEGDEILIERLKDKKEKDEVRFKDLLSHKTVIATVLGEEKGEKVKIFKYKPKNRYRKRIGHRQIYTKIKIKEIK